MTRRSLLDRMLVVIAVACGSPAAATSEIPRAVRADLEYLKAFVARDPDKDARSSMARATSSF